MRNFNPENFFEEPFKLKTESNTERLKEKKETVSELWLTNMPSALLSYKIQKPHLSFDTKLNIARGRQIVPISNY